MGFVKFESVDHANRVADLLGMERPYTDILGNEPDPTLDAVKDRIAMAFGVSSITGEKKTISELLEMSSD